MDKSDYRFLTKAIGMPLLVTGLLAGAVQGALHYVRSDTNAEALRQLNKPSIARELSREEMPKTSKLEENIISTDKGLNSAQIPENKLDNSLMGAELAPVEDLYSKIIQENPYCDLAKIDRETIEKIQIDPDGRIRALGVDCLERPRATEYLLDSQGNFLYRFTLKNDEFSGTEYQNGEKYLSFSITNGEIDSISENTSSDTSKTLYYGLGGQLIGIEGQVQGQVFNVMYIEGEPSMGTRYEPGSIEGISISGRELASFFPTIFCDSEVFLRDSYAKDNPLFNSLFDEASKSFLRTTNYPTFSKLLQARHEF